MLSKQERRKLNGYQFVQSNISLLLIVTINELPLRLGYSYRVTLYTGIVFVPRDCGSRTIFLEYGKNH